MIAATLFVETQVPWWYKMNSVENSTGLSHLLSANISSSNVIINLVTMAQQAALLMAAPILDILIT